MAVVHENGVTRVVERYVYDGDGTQFATPGDGCRATDIDCDGVVGAADLVLVRNAIDPSTPVDGVRADVCGDPDGTPDGYVTTADLACVRDALGRGIPGMYAEAEAGGLRSADDPAPDRARGLHGLPVDHASGLIYARARYYHPKLGRWMRRDPKGYVDGGNLYEAFLSNHARFTDPMGTAVKPYSIVDHAEYLGMQFAAWLSHKWWNREEYGRQLLDESLHTYVAIEKLRGHDPRTTKEEYYELYVLGPQQWAANVGQGFQNKGIDILNSALTPEGLPTIEIIKHRDWARDRYLRTSEFAYDASEGKRGSGLLLHITPPRECRGIKRGDQKGVRLTSSHHATERVQREANCEYAIPVPKNGHNACRRRGLPTSRFLRQGAATSRPCHDAPAWQRIQTRRESKRGRSWFIDGIQTGESKRGRTY